MSVAYLYSLYLAVTCYSGLGDGDFYSNSPAEAIAMIVFLMFNVIMAAYILGEYTYGLTIRECRTAEVLSLQF